MDNAFSMQAIRPVIIIGSGAAGLSCALRLAEAGRAATIVCKSALVSGSTAWAQGGIASVLGDDDRLDSHIADTCAAGAGLCDPAAVRHVVEHGAEVVRWLQRRGVAFTQDAADPDGQRLHLGREGGHSCRRIVHVADATGHAVASALAERVASEPRITVHEHTCAVDLHVGGTPRRISGVRLLDCKSGRVHDQPASAIVLATGGANQVYQHLSNPKGAPGDGIAMAWRAGCRIANMEFMQFHPTGFYNPGGQSFLISEALRGEGAVLRLPDGSRFMHRFDARGELAPRDIVSSAIHHEMQRLQTNHVLLDITHKDPGFVRSHFPTIHGHCLHAGIDMARAPIPVVPVAHFTCGGILTDLHGRTDISGLYAIGEVACTGLHGANRLASNSLLECLVHARAAAHDLCVRPTAPGATPILLPLPGRAPKAVATRACNRDANPLRRVMWDHVGIVRTTDGLLRAQRYVNDLQPEIEKQFEREPLVLELVEFRNLVTAAGLIIRSALSRQESRGAHRTLDFPHTDKTASPTILDPRAAAARAAS